MKVYTWSCQISDANTMESAGVNDVIYYVFTRIHRRLKNLAPTDITAWGTVIFILREKTRSLVSKFTKLR